MCAIAGFFSKGTPVPAATLEAMTDALAHRGPDDRGYFGWEADVLYHRWKEPGNRLALRAGLGFRRLSIIDLSAGGAQPMATPDERFWICFNGQIYNYIELKSELGDNHFRSQSDTEVLLQAFARWGVEGLNRLNGMFAFAVFDRVKRELTLARDPLGIKPLYYFVDERGIFFASEIRSLLKALPAPPALRTSLLARYLLNNWMAEPDTLFEGIQRLEPGHYLVVNDRLEIEKKSYWDFQFQPDTSIPEGEWEKALAVALRHSVARHLRSDVPVGFFLSGGLDSSLLTAQASRLLAHRPTAFTIGFQWSGRASEQADLKFAKMLAAKFPVDHRPILLEPAIVSLLPKVIAALEEPLADPAAICSYLICEAASGKFKVLISGQGADEIFGGYPVFQAGLIAEKWQRLPGWVRGSSSTLVRALPYSIGPLAMQGIHRLKKIDYAASQPWPQTFATLRSPMRAAEAQSLLHPDLRKGQQPPFAAQQNLWENARQWDTYHQMMYLDAKTYLPALNLAYSDKTSMAHSVELRVPFLDREVLDLVQRIPSAYKINWHEGKVVLRRVARQVLPHALITRRKAGFGLPLRSWLRSELQPMAADLLSSSRLQRQGIFDPELPSRWLKEHGERRADYSMRLYSLMTFQLWYDQLVPK